MHFYILFFNFKEINNENSSHFIMMSGVFGLLMLRVGLLMVLNHRGGIMSQKETKPHRLTGGANKLHDIQIATLDQCFPRHKKAKPFGIEFRLPFVGALCDRGITICYPSTLTTMALDYHHTFGELTVNSELFNLDNNLTALDQECQKLVLDEKRMATKKDLANWRGLIVYTEPKDDGQRVMKLSRWPIGHANANSNQSVEIRGTQRQFVLNLGNENDPFAYVTTDFDDEAIFEFGEEDRQKRDAYKQLAAWGAPLKDFAGFWTLGLDMLPWLEDHMHLYVRRDCYCTMEAWFIRSTDSSSLVQPKVSAGSTDCVYPPTNITYAMTELSALSPPLQADHLLYIRLMTYPDTDYIRFTLNDIETSKPLMLFEMFNTSLDALYKMGSETVTSIYLRQKNVTAKTKTEDNKCYGHISDKYRGTRELFFKFAFTKFGVGLNIWDSQGDIDQMALCEKEYFAPKWWEGTAFEAMKSFQMEGKFMLLDHKPIVMPFVNKETGEKNYDARTVPVPASYFITQLHKGSKIMFRIQPDNETDFSFQISLLHDRPVAEHPKIGATVMRMTINQTHISMDSFSVDDNLNKQKPIEHYKNYTKEAMEIVIVVVNEGDRTSFDIKINDQEIGLFNESMPTWATNFILVDDNNKAHPGKGIRLLQQPNISTPQEDTTMTADTVDLPFRLLMVLNYGDQIDLDVLLRNGTTEFGILFLHEAFKFHEKIGDILLWLRFDLDKTEDVFCNYFLHEENKEDAPITSNAHQKHLLNKYGQHFRMRIKCANNGFIVRIDDVGFHMECPYPIPTKPSLESEATNYRYPPWTVDHIWIHGNAFNVTHMKIRHSPPGVSLTTDHIRHFREIDDRQGFRIGDSIIANISSTKPIHQLASGSFIVSVNLFYEALHHHAMIGRTILEVLLKDTSGNIYFMNNERAEKNGTGKMKDTWGIGKGLSWDNGLNFLIKAVPGGFNVSLNGLGPRHFHANASLWAIQYATVHVHYEGIKAHDQNITVECVPKERCFPQHKLDTYI